MVSPHDEWEPVLKRAGNETESKDLPVQFVKSLIEKVEEVHLGLKRKKIVMSEKDRDAYHEANVCWL